MLTVTCALAALLLHFPGQPAPADLPDFPGRPGPPAPPDWRWPLSPVPRVVRDYRPPPRPWLPGHRGVDLAAPPGRPVFAAGPGRVGYAGRLAGRGVVTVVHGALRTSYLPVRSAVRPGQRVAAGQRLGLVEDIRGHCGRVTCLHWGLRRGLVYLDPLTLLGRGPVRLLPVWRPSSGTRAYTGTAVADPASRLRPRPSPAVRVAAHGGSLDHGRSMILTSATAAGGGAIAGAALAYVLILSWRRMPARRRLPPDVIDFTRERRRRQPPA
ncbi:MAG TPA: M23 family metallopeptidase [Streptosporangiaceae bacterium]|nr:M23 family metallopeptidase [Streptosporangiaceae bacterium]